jgi:NADPH-dependent methylglyoxal reductase
MATLVTGVNGYIASEIVFQLLSRGKKVVGTVRNESRTALVRETFSSQIESGQLKLVYTDIADLDAITRIFKENQNIVNVIHVSTSLGRESNDHMNDTILPTINGLEHMLLAAKEHAPDLKQFVYTSSLVALRGNKNLDYVYSSKDFNPTPIDGPISDVSQAYTISKTYAEKAAMKFMHENDVQFELKIVVVPYVFGPFRLLPKTKNEFGRGNKWLISAIGATSMPDVPDDVAVYGDVRYVADVHMFLSDSDTSPSGNKRYLIFDGHFSFPYIFQIMDKCYPEDKVFVPENSDLPGKLQKYDISESERDLKVKHYTLKQTIVDMLTQYHDAP